MSAAFCCLCVFHFHHSLFLFVLCVSNKLIDMTAASYAKYAFYNNNNNNNNIDICIAPYGRNFRGAEEIYVRNLCQSVSVGVCYAVKMGSLLHVCVYVCLRVSVCVYVYVYVCACRYVDRLTANLRKLTNDADKMASLSRLMSTRHGEAVDEQRQLEPQLDLLRRRTKELQQQVTYC